MARIDRTARGVYATSLESGYRVGPDFVIENRDLATGLQGKPRWKEKEKENQQDCRTVLIAL